MFNFGQAGKGPLCSFCGKSELQVAKLIAGPGVYICDECVELCQEIVVEEKVRATTQVPGSDPLAMESAILLAGNSLRPAISQLCRVLSRRALKAGLNENEGPEDHIILAGAAGSGKTALLQALSEVYAIPLATMDASEEPCTACGAANYNELFLRLVRAAEYDLRRAQRGIVVFEHVEQLSSAHQGLLRQLRDWMDGLGMVVRHRDNPREGIEIETRRILFVLCARLEEHGANTISDASLARHGIDASCAARFPVRIVLPEPTVSDIRAIMDADNSRWRQYLHWLEQAQPSAILADEAWAAVAERAVVYNVGAWGLSRVIENMEQALAASDEVGPVTVDRDMHSGRAEL